MNELTIKNGACEFVKKTFYPDGQLNVVLSENIFNNKKPLEILASIRNWEELNFFLATISALKQANYWIIKIRFYYLFGMRSDRIFEVGGASYFADVVSPILNTLGLDYRFRWSHALAHRFVTNSVKDIYLSQDEENAFRILDNNTLNLGADESCGNPYFPWGFHIGNFIKKRGKNTFVLDLPPRSKNKIIGAPCSKIFIYDDCCDGGGTFLAIANYLNENFPHHDGLYLFVYASIHNDLPEELFKHYKHIWCTNALDVNPHENLTIIEVI